jgi:hypothetical protein
MGRRSAISKERLKEIRLGAGVLYKNFNFATMTGTVVGITRDGATFTVDREVKEIGMDGAIGHVKGSRYTTDENASLSANILSWSEELFLNALPGATSENFPSTDPTHKKITCSQDISDEDYLENVVLEIRRHGGGFDYYAIKNALCDGGMEIATADKDEAPSQITFTAHYDPEVSLELRPWEIYPFIPGSPAVFSLTYLAGPNGTLVGEADQRVTSGNDGEPIFAQAASGHVFEKWSDGSTANPRTDTNVTSNKILVAIFVGA